MNSLQIKNLSHQYPGSQGELKVLDQVQLDVKPGEFISIVGTSGCGKSTLLRLIGGLEQASEGEILLDNQIIRAPGLDRGIVFQEPRLFPWLTVEENIAFGCRGHRDENEKLVQDHVKLAGLAGFEKAYPHQLSGGMQQRTAMARALVSRPQILLLDEPFGALDALTRIQMQQEVLKIWQAEKITVILVTHDIDEAVYLGDRVLVMSNRPGTFKKTLPVVLDRPRDRNSVEFSKLRKEIYDEFFSKTV